MFKLTRPEWETFKRRHNPEVFTKSMMDNWIEGIKEDLIKAETGEELDEPTTKLVTNFREELQSFQKVTVINSENTTLNKGLIYEEYYIRPQQVEWFENDITKSETVDIEKSRYGKYMNTELNRKLGRVGVEFGKKGEKKEEGERTPWGKIGDSEEYLGKKFTIGESYDLDGTKLEYRGKGNFKGEFESGKPNGVGGLNQSAIDRIKTSSEKKEDKLKGQQGAFKIISRAKQIAKEKSTNKEDAFAEAASEVKTDSEAYLLAQEQYLQR